ncbi:MAG: tripartite tricarboxylate transporter permease, partial [Candidatus Rokuibacteriota bacterium]
MLLGVGIGFGVGILPGLGGPTTLALMLPFVFKMTPVEAFAFLLGMYAVTNTTGDITSILFGIPGEPTSAATIVDGHAMAKNGEAGRALGAAMMSSLVGAVFGALVLGLAIPILRPLVLSFGSPEFFMLAVLGITFVASLSGEATLKGLVAGGLGLGLATVGLDPVSSVQRFTFGQLFLWDGIGLVAVTIGFYAIPEVIDLAVQGSSIAKAQVGRLGGVWQGVRDTFRHWLLVLRCSALGTFVAVIPGIGAATTQWLAYAHAVQTSPGKERFGRGAVEGVIGPGAANNSTLGGSLVTTVAFGVPASVGTAILMGAFIIQGLVPGPSMLTPAPRGHLTVTFAMVWTIVIANVITVAACLAFMNTLARVTRIRGTLLTPFILTLIYVGAFAEKNVFADLAIVLVFGALGWMMARLGWPRPPLLLGLVLGPLAENRLFLSTDNYGAAWLARPGVIVLLALTAAGLAVPIWSERRRRR